MKRHADYFIVEENRAILTGFVQDIMEVITGHFQELGLDFDFKKRDVVVRQNIPCPKFWLEEENPYLRRDTIFLHCSKCSYWCKVVFQLAHELSHCYIYCHNSEKSKGISWVEETICEAMAMYFLDYFRKNWTKICLSRLNPTYDEAFADYLNDILVNEEGNGRLSVINSVDELKDINKNATIRREDRKEEVDVLWHRLKADEIYGLFCYRDYAKKHSVLMDTAAYLNAFKNNDAVDYICYLQDRIFYKK